MRRNNPIVRHSDFLDRVKVSDRGIQGPFHTERDESKSASKSVIVLQSPSSQSVVREEKTLSRLDLPEGTFDRLVYCSFILIPRVTSTGVKDSSATDLIFLSSCLQTVYGFDTSFITSV